MRKPYYGTTLSLVKKTEFLKETRDIRLVALTSEGIVTHVFSAIVTAFQCLGAFPDGLGLLLYVPIDIFSNYKYIGTSPNRCGSSV